MTSKKLIIIGGPTGVGKTKLAIELAQSLKTEIVSADSRQLYKEMSIGTAVPAKEELEAVKHYFIHSHSIHSRFNASTYEEEAVDLLNKLFLKYNTVIMVGGSGMYIDAVCNGIDDLPTIDLDTRKKFENLYQEKGLTYIQQELKKIDPTHYKTVDLNNHKRILKALEVNHISGMTYSSFLSKPKKERSFTSQMRVINTDRETLYRQINQRVDNMIHAGLIEEAKNLYQYKTLTPLLTVGYKELFSCFDKEISESEAIEQIKNHSRAYARRQITWFRRYSDAKWFEPHQADKILGSISDL